MSGEQEVLLDTQTILVPVDLSDVSAQIVEQAANLSKSLGAKVVILHVEENDATSFFGLSLLSETEREKIANMRGGERRVLRELERICEDRDVPFVSVSTLGEPVDKILEAAEKHNAQMVVIGSHGHGAFYHLIAPGVSEGVLQNAPCPVLVVRSKPQEIQEETVNQ